MAYSEEGRKSRKIGKTRVTKYKASKGADFDDDTVRSIKTKTKYDKEGEIKKIKRVKKTESGGKMVTISKPGLENNSLSPEGSIGVVTVRQRENRRMKKELGPMAKLHGGPDNNATGNDKNNTSDLDLSNVASNMANVPDLFKDIKQIKGNIKENIQYPKYGDSDSKFIDGKDEGEFTKYEGKPPYRLKSEQLTTGKTFYQGDK